MIEKVFHFHSPILSKDPNLVQPKAPLELPEATSKLNEASLTVVNPLIISAKKA